MGLCRDDRGHEHYSKGLYDNNEQKNFTNAKYNSPFLFLCLNSWMEWLTRRLLKSYKQGWHRLQVEEEMRDAQETWDVQETRDTQETQDE